MKAEELLILIQRNQHNHDEIYHKEIARLPVSERLQHMALHISKYFSQFVEESQGRYSCDKEWKDSFIISTSICNILNTKISDLWGLTDKDVMASDLRDYIKSYISNDMGESSELCMLSDINYELSNACEKIDHLEDYAYRPNISWAASRLAAYSAEKVMKKGDLYDEITSRLMETKRKNIMHVER